jgi:dinuclear metal center YbgI/SA1388 family protein
MKLAAVVNHLEQIAPTRFAESWDNVGLLAGDADANIRRVLLAIDFTAAVAREAKSQRADLVIAYHPPIFDALKKLTAPNPVFDAIRNGIALYSPHTALDIADGGTNDMLADVLGMTDRAPLRLSDAKSREYKLVTFVPPEHLESVSRAIFAAGAGQIGDYTSCSFRTEGTGTFFGGAGTHPKVGQRGHLETVREIRLETIVPIAQIDKVIGALRKSHPYEEPAFDLNQLAATTTHGMGRIGTIQSISRRAIFARIKRGLKLKTLLIAGPQTGSITRAAVCAGSCGNLIQDAISARADLFLTGEVRHHDALKAAAAGMTVVCALHSNSERPVLARVQAKLKKLAPDLRIEISRADRDPFDIA